MTNNLTEAIIEAFIVNYGDTTCRSQNYLRVLRGEIDIHAVNPIALREELVCLLGLMVDTWNESLLKALFPVSYERGGCAWMVAGAVNPNKLKHDVIEEIMLSYASVDPHPGGH